MKKKISRILIILLYLTPCNIIILAYILFAWFGSYISEKTYYIPETGTYMKIYEPGRYIAFGDSANFTLSQSTNYFTLLDVLGANIVLDPQDKNIVFVDHFYNKKDIIKNVVEHNHIADTLFFNQVFQKDGPIIYQLKSPYTCVRILEFANEVLIYNKNTDVYNDLKPIAEKKYFNPKYFKSRFSWITFWRNDNNEESSNTYFLFHLNEENTNREK